MTFKHDSPLLNSEIAKLLFILSYLPILLNKSWISERLEQIWLSKWIDFCALTSQKKLTFKVSSSSVRPKMFGWPDLWPKILYSQLMFWKSNFTLGMPKFFELNKNDFSLHCKPIPCNEYRIPAQWEEGFPVIKTGFCPVRITTQGKPFSGPVLALYGIAVYSHTVNNYSPL